jgi:hypothetical protein
MPRAVWMPRAALGSARAFDESERSVRRAAVEHDLVYARRLQQVFATERPLRCFEESNDQRVTTGEPFGSVSRRALRSSCQPAKRRRPGSLERSSGSPLE